MEKNESKLPSINSASSEKLVLKSAIALNKFLLFKFRILAELTTLVGNIIELKGTAIKKMFVSSQLEKLIIANNLNKQIWELFAVSKLDSRRGVFTMKDFKNVVKTKIVSLLKKDNLEESIRQLEPVFRETFKEDIETLEKVLRRKKIFTLKARNQIIENTANESANEMYLLMQQELFRRVVFQCFNSKHTIINNYTFNSIEAFLGIMNKELSKKNKSYEFEKNKTHATPRKLVTDIKQKIEPIIMKKGLSLQGEDFLKHIVEKYNAEPDVQKDLTEELRGLFYKGILFNDFLNILSAYKFTLTDEEKSEIYLIGKNLGFFKSEESIEENEQKLDNCIETTVEEKEQKLNISDEINQKSKFDLCDFELALKNKDIAISEVAFNSFQKQFNDVEQKKILLKVVSNNFEKDKNRANGNDYFKLVFKREGWRVVANESKEIIKFYRDHDKYEQDLKNKLI